MVLINFILRLKYEVDDQLGQKSGRRKPNQPSEQPNQLEQLQLPLLPQAVQLRTRQNPLKLQKAD